MRIGIPKETKTLEGRVALVPAAAGDLVKRGHEVWLEQDAGVEAVTTGARVTQATVDGALCRDGSQATARAGARIDQFLVLQMRQGRVVKRCPLALHEHFAIPFKAEACQRAQDVICCTGEAALGVDVLDAQQPLAAPGAGFQIAAYGRQQ